MVSNSAAASALPMFVWMSSAFANMLCESVSINNIERIFSHATCGT